MFLQNLKTILRSNLFFICFLFIVICFCFIYYQTPKKSKYSLDVTEITGNVESFKMDGNFLSMEVKALEKVQVFYYFKTLEEKEYFMDHLMYGMKINVEGTMNEPSKASLPHTFDYHDYLYYQNIYRTMTASKITFLEKGNLVEQIKTYFYRYISSRVHSEYLLALILGNSDNMEVEVIRDNGISHLFAVSGMHISLFITFLNKIFARFGKKKDIFFNIFLFFYAFLVGFTPSVLRCVWLFFGMSLNRFFELKLSRLKVFLFVFLGMLLWNPFYLMDLGFQYSFFICFTFFFLKPSKSYWKNLLKTSTVATLASIPISAIHFYEINLLSVIWNLLFVPFVTFLLYPACFLYLLLPFFLPILSLCISLFERINTFCQKITFGTICLPYIPPLYWIIYIVFLLLFLKSKNKTWLLYLCIFVVVVKTLPKLDTASYVYFLDVNQGDSTLFVSPLKKEIILVDTGGTLSFTKEDWEIRKRKVKQGKTIKTFLYSLGITDIDCLVLTHGDYDHIGNAKDILAEIPCHTILLNSNAETDLEKEIHDLYPTKVHEYDPSFFKWHIYTSTSKEENMASIVLKIQVSHFSFLMMADAPKERERSMLEQSISSDVLKIGHHGSSTSSDPLFLKKVNPSYAIISVGLKNRYNHPSKEKIENLQNLNIPYYETSKYKTIWFKISKNKMKMYTLKENS